jgi:hypothetical protein
MLYAVSSSTPNELSKLNPHIQFDICYFSPHENTKAAPYLFIVQIQGISKTGSGDTG